ncbi:alpha/beta fold hydrolase [Paenibacillus eucommiae]|uniref:Pimeloyl-ACP methyl ester carboxylesterase n=1 Tax=Paenibacillus eucommiae TaxID=1355755 RepID=A0ABS4J0Y1_9BACL|nr:alpha/beta hydrolase [Paenibacillus eucommiae]MBP1992911.1 pimeloyl-ACP methyl ester carboxylesterase [Paenibacillus eucommiae]
MKASVHGVTIAYEDEGQGLPVILLHGFPLDHHMWKHQTTALKEGGFRVITPDMRGMGGSEVPTDTISLENYADDVLALLDHLDIPKAVLGGFSMGGYIAFSMLRKAPDRFTALVLADTKPEADSPEAQKNRMNLAAALFEKGSIAASDAMIPKMLTEKTRNENPHLEVKLHSIIESTNPLSLVHASIAMAFRQDATALLTQITVPTLVIVGEEDQVTPIEVMKQMADQIYQSQFVKIPESAHLTPMENPEAFNKALLEFLQGLGD